MRPIILLFLVVFLFGCTQQQMRAMTQTMKEINDSSPDHVNEGWSDYNFNTSQEVNYSDDSGNSNTQQYLINTPNGQKRVTCRNAGTQYQYCF